MKSDRQRRLEIRAKRLKRAKKLLAQNSATSLVGGAPAGAVPANHQELQHNNTYGTLPDFYVDVPFVCRDCGAEALWTAKQQKWWYEVAKGHIDSRAVRCHRCRTKIRDEKARQKRHMEEMAAREPHPHEAFFRPASRSRKGH